MKLVALQPIRHDGKRYNEGDQIEIADKAKHQAVALIACGAAESLEKSKSRSGAEAKRHAQAIADAKNAVDTAEGVLAKASEEDKPAAQVALDAAKAALADLDA